jgi:hypothetical protein
MTVDFIYTKLFGYMLVNDNKECCCFESLQKSAGENVTFTVILKHNL